MPTSPSIELPGLPSLPILHEDTLCFAIDKPAGWHVPLRPPFPPDQNLRRALEKSVEAKAPWAEERHLQYIAPVSTVEYDVSGIVVFIRDARDIGPFGTALSQRPTIREFLVVIGGKPKRRRWTCCLKIRPDPADPTRVLTHTQQGQSAETDFEVVGHGDGMALVIARPWTDRPHQIRAHLAAHELPIVGDTIYGFGRRAPVKQHGVLPRLRKEIRRETAPPLALRAIRLAFETPVSRVPVEILAPFDEFLAHFGFENDVDPETDPDDEAAT